MYYNLDNIAVISASIPALLNVHLHFQLHGKVCAGEQDMEAIHVFGYVAV